MGLNIIDRFIGELKDALRYFKSRSEHKYYGDRFEEWVVQNSNIKNNFKNSQKPNYWELVEWRSDKYINGYFPASSLSPDLILKCISQQERKLYQNGDLIAIECKWRSKLKVNTPFYINKKDVIKYEKYLENNDFRSEIQSLFYAIGFGWNEDKPEEIYIIPSKILYEYDRESENVIFKNPTVEDLQKYKYSDKEILYYR